MKDKTLLDEFAIMAMASIPASYNSAEDWATAGYEHAKKIMRIRNKYLEEHLNEEYSKLDGRHPLEWNAPLEGIPLEDKPTWLLKLESVAGVSEGYDKNTILTHQTKWAAVDDDGFLYFYSSKPKYYKYDEEWNHFGTYSYHSSGISFPTIKPYVAQYCLVEIK